jgi:hypothetical protein
MRKEIALAEPVVPYCKYEITNTSMRHLEDSVRNLIARVHSEQSSIPLDTILFEYYGKRADTLPDTLFMTAHGEGRLGTGGVWHAVYLVVRSNGAWSWSPVIELRRGARIFRIDSSFDLNGDGVKEFLVMNYAGGAVYSLKNGRLLLVMSSDYRGC